MFTDIDLHQKSGRKKTCAWFLQ